MKGPVAALLVIVASGPGPVRTPELGRGPTPPPAALGRATPTPPPAAASCFTVMPAPRDARRSESLARSAEVIGRNGCDVPVPPSAALFEVLVVNVAGEIVRRATGQIPGGIPAHGEVRHSVEIEVPMDTTIRARPWVADATPRLERGAAAPPVTLRDVARQRVPADTRQGRGTFNARLDSQFEVTDVEVTPGSSGAYVRGRLRSRIGQSMRVAVAVAGLTEEGGEASALLRTSPDAAIPPGGSASFSGNVPGALPDSLVFVAVSVHDLGGRIETAAERKRLDEEARCLTFTAIRPTADAEPALSAEVRVRNACSWTIPADRTWFTLDVVGRNGARIERRTDSFSQDVLPGEERRRMVRIPIPPGAAVRATRVEPTP